MKKMALLLAAVMLTGVVGGCGAQKDKGDSDVPTLTWYVPGDKQNDMKAVMEEANKIIEPAIGAKLDLQMIDTGSYAEKLQMMMAASEVFDLMFTGYINTYTQCVSRGGLMDITELLETQTPGFLDTIPEYILDSAYVDGKIYAVPNAQVIATQPAIGIRHDVAQEYGLDLEKVTSPDDLADFYDWILANKPGLYPMRAINMTAAIDTDYYAVIDGYVTTKADLTDGDAKITVVPECETDMSRERADKLYEWYRKGWIRNDVMTTSNDAADYSAGKYVTFFCGWKPGFEQNLASTLGMEYDVVKVPVDRFAGSSTSSMIGVSRTCKNPEKAVKFIELINTNKDLYNLIVFGIEGKHYTKNEEGKVIVNAEGGYNQKSGDWKFGSQFNALVKEGQDADIWEQTAAFNDESIKNPLSGFVFDNTKVAAEVASVETINAQYNVRMYGAQNPEEYWNEMVEKYKNAGVDKIAAELQSQIDAYLAKNAE